MGDPNLVVKEIVRRYLVMNNFEGLFHEDGECACKLDDLMPCDGDIYMGTCEVGYIAPCEDPDFTFCIGREKHEDRKSKIG